ncbi:MAG: hypothetical protein ACMUIP_00260 [bacterium]
MKKTVATILLSTVFIMSHAASALSCVGARPMAMGGAFIAIADDVNAVYWNPAGLSQLQQKEVTFTRTIFNRDNYNYDDFLAFALPIKKGRGALALSYINSGYRTSNLITENHWFVLSGGLKIIRHISLGANIRILHTGIKYTRLEYMVGDVTYSDYDTNIGMDLTMLWKITERFSTGLLIQNMNEPTIELLSELNMGSSKQLCNVRPAVAYKLTDRILTTVEMYDAFGESENTSVDVSQDLRIGVESRLSDNFTIRWGAYHFKSLADGIKAYTYGYSHTFSTIPLSIDYCLMHWTTELEEHSYTHQLGVIYKW